ncbi:MAG TPA: hypothetical protein VGW33_04820 [Terriglobia bacterium]|nr:hypothetical protein [Terriglobia bacterium]
MHPAQFYEQHRIGIELSLAVVVTFVALRFPDAGGKWFHAVEEQLRRCAGRRRWSVLLVGAAALALRLAALPIRPIPSPAGVDEQSYLFGADTFASGRLTNPTHPMWTHFETFHINQQPTYCSKFPPAQAVFLAAGEVIAGHPFWGVWLSDGLMCAAICWMLQGWFAPEWALLGGLLVVMRLGVFNYWANSYFGGAVAAIGGALVLGALPRIKQRQRFRDAALMGAGVAILANSRPYEGLIFSLPIAVALLVWMCRSGRPPMRGLGARVLLPLLLVLVPAGCAMGYYFWRTTGSPFLMPYQVDSQAYDAAPYFLFQSLGPEPVYRFQVFRDLDRDWELQQYHAARSFPVRAALLKFKLVYGFFLGGALGLPVLFAFVISLHRFRWKTIEPTLRFLAIVCAVMMAGFVVETFPGFPHYMAPITGALIGLVLCAMQKLWPWRWQARPVGRFGVRASVLACFGLMLLHGVIGAGTPQRDFQYPGWWPRNRVRMTAAIEKLPGDQLVIVRYTPDHDPAYDWVFNKPDIDQAKIVWARDMGAAKNEELIKYFKDRQVWLLQADDAAPKLSPYTPHAEPAHLN